MTMAGRKKGGAMHMAGRKGGTMHIGARKRGGKFKGPVPRSALKKGGQRIGAGPQRLGAGKGGGLFGTLKNKAIDAAAPYVTTEINKRLGSSFTQAQVKAVLKNMKLSDIKSPKKALMKVIKILK